jgi:predicted CopG family antitoxin
MSRNTVKLTTITVRQDTYDRLKNLGKTAETFNDVISRVLDQLEGNKED